MDSRRLAGDLAHEMRRSRLLRQQAAVQIAIARAARRRSRQRMELLRWSRTDNPAAEPEQPD